MNNIERYTVAESGNTGWRVRIRKGPFRFTKSFLDKDNEGSEIALERAIACRDRQLSRLPRYPRGKTRGTVDTKARRNSSSGHPGVTFSRGWWYASWSVGGNRKRKGFSQFALGDEAKQKAIEFRERKLVEVAADVVRSFAMEDMTGISLLPDDEGWLVRVGYENRKPKYQRRFGAASNNGLCGALRKAVMYRDRVSQDVTVVPRREERTGFVREITTETYGYVSQQVARKSEKFECAGIRSDVEQLEIVQEVLLAYASKPDDQIRDHRHYLNTLVKMVVDGAVAKKRERLFKNPTWVDQDGEDGEESVCLQRASM